MWRHRVCHGCPFRSSTFLVRDFRSSWDRQSGKAPFALWSYWAPTSTDMQLDLTQPSPELGRGGGWPVTWHWHLGSTLFCPLLCCHNWRSYATKTKTRLLDHSPQLWGHWLNWEVIFIIPIAALRNNWQARFFREALSSIRSRTPKGSCTLGWDALTPASFSTCFLVRLVTDL